MQEEYKAITLLCSLPESWDHFITSISLSIANSLKFESVVGALLSEEVRRKSSIETFAPKSMVARGRSKERGRKQGALPDENQRAARSVKPSAGTATKWDTSRNIVGNGRSRKTITRKKIRLIPVWLMRF